MLPTQFRFIWPSGFRREDFFKSANQKQELPMAAMFVNMSNLYKGLSTDRITCKKPVFVCTKKCIRNI